MIDSHFLAPTPAAAGIDGDKLEALLARVGEEVAAGLLPACQVAIARHGRVAALRSYGSARDDSLFCVFSSTKALTSAAAWLLIEDGRLDVSRRVCDVIPEFASNGKDAVRIEQLFTHTAGFPAAPFRPTDWHDRALRNERYAGWRLNWTPGTRFEYHPSSGMWVIAELIERIADTDFATFVRERVLRPLGLRDLWLGCPESEHHRILPVTHAGTAMTPDEYRAMGLPVPPVTEVTEDALQSFNTAAVRKVPIPGGGGITGAGELALFYQALLTGRADDGATVWKPQTLANALTVRNTFPDAFGTPANRALGVVIAGDEKRNARGFGHSNTPAAFGHGGAGGQIAWADPGTGISFGYVTSGHDRNAIRQGRRGVSISNRAAVCALAG